MASSYFTLNTTAGTGAQVISVTPTGLNNTYSDRYATITVTNGTSTKLVAVRQYGVPNLYLQNGQSTTVQSTGGTVYYTMTSHYDYKFINIPDWITITIKNATVEQDVWYTPTSNAFAVSVRVYPTTASTASQSTGMQCVFNGLNGGPTVAMTITRLGRVTDTFTITPESRFFGPDADDNVFTVTPSNASRAWIAYANTSSPWINVEDIGEVTGEAEVNYEIEENTTGAYRNGIICVRYVSDTDFHSVPIGQCGDDACDGVKVYTADKTVIYLSGWNTYGTVPVDLRVFASGSWNIARTNWINVSPNAGLLGETIVGVGASANTGTTMRTGDITIRNSDSESKYYVTVNQLPTHILWNSDAVMGGSSATYDIYISVTSPYEDHPVTLYVQGDCRLMWASQSVTRCYPTYDGTNRMASGTYYKKSAGETIVIKTVSNPASSYEEFTFKYTADDGEFDYVIRLRFI